ncbi:MAG: leucine-rich repeat domain-containing protein, partial [Muribaculaceae bacterium]|nr:leucine-rich repeat domain-containing protein [Muribaculaceae bacterium]
MKQFFLEVNIFLLLCALSVLPSKAHQGAEVVGNTIFYYNNVDGGVEITYNSNTFISLYSGTIEIPAELDGKKVVAIGYNAFAGSSIQKVTIPTGVKKIGAGAFFNCQSLYELTLRTAEIPEVAATAFESKSNITLKTYPRYAETFKTFGFKEIQTDIKYDGSVEVVTEIELADPLHMTYYYYEFADGVEITYKEKEKETYPGNLYIPSEINGKPVIGISDYAFSGCTRSTVITIPAGVRVIREKAFEYCDIN